MPAWTNMLYERFRNSDQVKDTALANEYKSDIMALIADEPTRGINAHERAFQTAFVVYEDAWKEAVDTTTEKMKRYFIYNHDWVTDDGITDPLKDKKIFVNTVTFNLLHRENCPYRLRDPSGTDSWNDPNNYRIENIAPIGVSQESLDYYGALSRVLWKVAKVNSTEDDSPEEEASAEALKNEVRRFCAIANKAGPMFPTEIGDDALVALSIDLDNKYGPRVEAIEAMVDPMS